MDIEKLKELKIDSYLDIGANTGQFYDFIKTIFPAIYVEMIEPNPWAVSKLKKRWKNITIHPYGAGNVDKDLPFSINKYKKYSKGASFLKDYQLVDVDVLDVAVRKLDSLFQDKFFDLIKIDTEGFEFEVLKGAEQTIAGSKYLLIEMPKNNDLINWLKQRNYYATSVLHKNAVGGKVVFDILFEKNSAKKEIKIKNY